MSGGRSSTRVPAGSPCGGGTSTSPRDLLDVPLDGSAGAPSDRPVFAVCAHGRHDQCCAVRGRAVAARLASAYPEETWECSHLGGDRFAGTMVLLPHGLYYGWVDDGDAVTVADAYLAGRVEPRFLRGRSAYSHPVQAAQHFARDAAGRRPPRRLPAAGRGTARPTAGRSGSTRPTVR